MRRTLLAFTLLVGLLVFPSAASATHDLLGFQSAVDAMQAVDPTLDPPPNDGKHDFVVGGFEIFDGDKFGLSAHSDPLGSDAWGHISQTSPEREFRLRGRVTCLAVAGNVAAYGFVTTHARSNTDDAPGDEFVDVVVDSGLPGGAGDRWVGFANVDAETCSQSLPAAAAAAPITRGNILVHDAQP